MKRIIFLLILILTAIDVYAGPFDEDQSITIPKPVETTAPSVPSVGVPETEKTDVPLIVSAKKEEIPDSIGKQVDLAIERSKKRGIKIISGADKINIADLNNWLVHFRDMNGVNGFITGQELALVKAIRDISGKTGRKLTAGEVLEISLKLNNGDMAKSLLTLHNAFRQLSRGRDEISGISQDTSFFHKYLDSGAVGKANAKPGEDISDEWYHYFGLATMAFVGENKSTLAAGKDFVNRAKGNDTRANISTFVGILKSGLSPFSWVPGNGAGASIAVNDALGEQAFYGFMAAVGDYASKNRNGKFFHDCWVNLKSWSKGFSGLEGDEFAAELRGTAMGSYISAKI